MRKTVLSNSKSVEFQQMTVSTTLWRRATGLPVLSRLRLSHAGVEAIDGRRAASVSLVSNPRDRSGGDRKRCRQSGRGARADWILAGPGYRRRLERKWDVKKHDQFKVELGG
jgi:hypothetical protein